MNKLQQYHLFFLFPLTLCPLHGSSISDSEEPSFSYRNITVEGSKGPESITTIEEQLQEAIDNKAIKKIEELLKKDAKRTLKWKDKDGKTVTHWAALWGKTETVKDLLKRGANPNQKNNRGNSPVMSAVYSGNIKTIEAIVEGGGELRCKGKGGDNNKTIWEPIDWAVITGNKSVVKYVLDELSKKKQDEKKILKEWTMLPSDLEQSKKNRTVFEILSDTETDLDNKENEWAFIAEKQEEHSLAQSPSLPETQEIDKKLDIGFVALELAVRLSKKEILQLLLENLEDLEKKEAMVNMKDEQGNPLLHKATKLDSEEIVEILLKNGAKMQEKDKQGRTALDVASQFDRKKVVQLLLENGAKMEEEKENTPPKPPTKYKKKKAPKIPKKAEAKSRESVCLSTVSTQEVMNRK